MIIKIIIGIVLGIYLFVLLEQRKTKFKKYRIIIDHPTPEENNVDAIYSSLIFIGYITIYDKIWNWLGTYISSSL